MFGLNSKDFAQIIVNVAFVATFIGIFYFTYAHKVEEQVIINQMNYISKSLLDEITVLVPKSNYDLVEESVSAVNAPDMTQQNIEVDKQNSELKNMAFKVIGGFAAVSLLIAYFMSSRNGFSFKNLLVNASFVVLVVGIVEYVFLTYFGSKFYSADPNYVKYMALYYLKQNSQNP